MVLKNAGVSFRVHRHADFVEPVRAPQDVARQLDYDLTRITKTLLVVDPRSRDHRVLVVLPIAAMTDFVRVGRSQGWQRAEMARPDELIATLGQQPGGVSPVGHPMLPVIVDRSLLACSTVLIGSGDVGVEIEMKPSALLQTTNGSVGVVAKE